jgi:hypothetical protein
MRSIEMPMKAAWLEGLLALIAICFHVSSSQAGPSSSEGRPITEGEKQFCAEDYKNFCGSYGLGSNALRNCMDRNGVSLSHGCVEALIDAGEVTRSEVERRKNAN